MASRAAVLRAAVDRDRAGLGRWVSEDFSGGGAARAYAIAQLQPRDFDAIARSLASGGTFRRPDYFCAPYWNKQRVMLMLLPPGLTQETPPSAVLFPTPVFERADAESRVVGELGFELVNVVGPSVDGFTPVRVEDIRGFVPSTSVSPQGSDQEVCFLYAGGRVASDFVSALRR